MPDSCRTVIDLPHSIGRASSAVSSFFVDVLAPWARAGVCALAQAEREGWRRAEAIALRLAPLAEASGRAGALAWRGALDFTAWTCRLSQGTVGRAARGAIAFSFGLSALAAAGLYETLFLDPFGYPDLDAFLASAPPTIGRIEDARGEVLAELAREYRRPIEDHELPPVMRRALLSAEDRDFYEHDGVDLGSWPRVVIKTASASWRAHRVAFPQGGSTLTQQLVRVAFLHDWWTRENGDALLVDSWPNRLLASVVGTRAANKARRKLEEIRLSLWLEDALARKLGSRQRAKEEILRRYAMYVYLGEGRYGFAAASEHYFGRPLASLGDDDADVAAVLAGIPKSPTAYSPSERNRAKVLRRRNLILHLMEHNGFLGGNERARLEWAPVPTRPAPEPSVRPDSAAAVSYVLDSLGTLEDPTLTSGAVFDGQIRLQSTIDSRLQKVVADALENGLRAYEERHPAERGRVQGSVVVLANSDARVLALVGGRIDVPADGATRFRDFNRATMSFRQAGSTMKPVVYFTALRSGLSLDTPVLDAPVWLPMGRGRPAKQVANYDGVFKGEISLRRALAESRNAATVHLAQLVGIPAVVRTAHELGIRSNLPPYITTALGAAEVTLLDLANVYRTFASGTRAEPWILRGVIARDNTALFARKGSATPLDDPALPLIQEALRGTVRLPGGTGRSLSSLPFAVFGKTGTTNDYRDALFAGSTFGPNGVTMAVRIGFDDNHSLGEGETGGRTALPVFREAVSTAYAAGLLGAPPRFPQDLEHDIDAYLVASAASPAPASAVPDAQPAGGQEGATTFTPASVSATTSAVLPAPPVLAPHGGGLEPADITPALLIAPPHQDTPAATAPGITGHSSS